jgi:hypothetical protein
MDNQFYTIDFLVTEQEVRHSVKGEDQCYHLPLTSFVFVATSFVFVAVSFVFVATSYIL